MRKLFFLVFCYFLCFSVMAQDVEPTVQNDNEEQEEELNAFGFPNKSLIKIIESTENDEAVVRSHPLPECNNDALLKQVRKTVSKYIDFDGTTILTKRNALLTLKNIDNFIILPQENVGASKHSIVAARLIELKINNHITKENIEICQSDNPVLKTKLYLVMYPSEQGKTNVEILNFAKDIVPTFVFEE